MLVSVSCRRCRGVPCVAQRVFMSRALSPPWLVQFNEGGKVRRAEVKARVHAGIVCELLQLCRSSMFGFMIYGADMMSDGGTLVCDVTCVACFRVCLRLGRAIAFSGCQRAVSYTHLTLPTICSV
eukprot:515141-Alexandrium_andersonii.AAC.1